MNTFKYIIVLITVLTIGIQTPLSAQHWAEENGWSFDNFSEPTLSWERFRETFIGVSPTKASSGNFDLLFFELIYETELAADGHCYGIDLMALMMLKHGGYLGFCHPPHIYPGSPTTGPTDPNLRRAMQILHGNQISHGFLLFLLDLIAQNKNRDGNYAAAQFEYFTAKDDPCIISITESLNPADGGHAVIAYDIVDFGATKRIMVWDPNRSYWEPGMDGKDYYDFAQNFIEVTTATGAWNFDMGGTTGVWSGDPGSGGNIITIPLSVAGRRDRLPQSLFADVPTALNSIFIFGEDAELEQITDEEGKRYFKPGTQEVETDPNFSMNNVLPFIPISGGASNRKGPKMYFTRGGSALDIQVKSKDNGYQLAVMGNRGYVSVTSPKGRGSSRVQISDIHSPNPKVDLSHNFLSSQHEVEIRTLNGVNEELRVFKMENLDLVANEKLTLGISTKGKSLEAASTSAILSYDLTLSNGKGNQVKQAMKLEAGERVLVTPPSWKLIKGKKLEVIRRIP